MWWKVFECLCLLLLQMVFYIQDSDDVYGLFRFHPMKEQRIQSQPVGRFLSLSFLRDKGTLGDVQLSFTALYIPAGPVDPTRARDGVLNGTRSNRLTFSGAQSEAELTLPIRNDAFLQNGAHFLIQVNRVLKTLSHLSPLDAHLYFL